jgi:pimeloyl-ACP methyl ester carboxylesterase
MRGKRKSASVAIVAVVVVAHIYSDYLHDLDEAQERISSGSKVVETPCGPIEYAVAGPDDGPKVLVVHGSGGGFDQGLIIGRPLAERGFRTIAPSRFGYLGTAVPQKVSVSAQADAHACLLDALNINKTVVFGFSAGARSSTKFAQNHPDRCSSLVLLIPGLANEANVQLPFGLLPLLILGVLRYDFFYWAVVKFARPVTIRTVFASPPGLYYKASDSEKARTMSFSTTYSR